MRFAFINDDVVKLIEDVEESEAMSRLVYYQQVVPIEGLSPEPQVGWRYNFKKQILFKYYDSITPRQIRQALLLSGIDLTMIDAALDSLPEPEKSFARISWDYAVAFDRDDPMVENVGLMLGWTTEQIDALWELGAKL
jgi:hypothetical protein